MGILLPFRLSLNPTVILCFCMVFLKHNHTSMLESLAMDNTNGFDLIFKALCHSLQKKLLTVI